jgi:hypothetical protein
MTVDRIVVRVKVGQGLMAASDDPLFLRLHGPLGREFRLSLAKGKSLRRGHEDTYVLSGPGGDANVANPELNDPSSPPLDLARIAGVSIRKGLDPVPNVRGVGEMDDRLLLEGASVTLEGGGATRRFRRDGPIWLGLICGLSVALAPEEDRA